MRELVEKIKNGDLLPSEHLEEIIEIIEEKEPTLKAYITLDFEGARKRAKELDKKVKEGDTNGLLFGLVVAVKDNLATKGLPLTCASAMLKNYVAPYDATAVERIKREGAIIIGKTNMDEFACGSSGETSHFGPTRNPHDPERVPGGSSSGSAVAVAAGMADLSLGSDTGGSIRNPASFTGIFGIKPSYGLVSRYGLVDLAMSLDTVGGFSPDADGIALLMEAIQGPDGRDDTVRLRLSFLKTFEEGVEGKIGYDPSVEEVVDGSVAQTYRRFINEVEKKGFEVVEINLPPFDKIWPLYYFIIYPEFASAMQRFTGLTYGERGSGEKLYEVISSARRAYLGKEVKRRIILGTYLSMAKYELSLYNKAVKLRNGLRAEIKKIFEKVDFLVTPTVPFLPFKIGERIDDPLKMYAADALTVLANLTGIPALNVPYGYKENIPIGIQIMGRWYEDDKVVALAGMIK